MPRVAVDPDDDGAVADARGLHAGGHLGRHPRGDPLVVQADREERSGVRDALSDVLDRVHFEERLEPALRLRVAELELLVRAVLRGEESRGVEGADGDVRRDEEIGPVGDRAADEDAPRAPAARREVARRRELVIDEVLRARLEVVDAVHLALAGEPLVLPPPPLLTSAAHVADGVGRAELEPQGAAPC